MSSILSIKGFVRGLVRLLAFASLLALCLVSSTVGAYTFYWESPRPLGDGPGRYPLVLGAGKDLLVLWQESELLPGGGGKADAPSQAWLSLSRLSGSTWTTQKRFAGPFAFRGAEPPLFSATAEGKSIAIAAADGDGKIAVLVSSDGGQSFSAAESLAPSSAAVAPRIFPSASGGYILFVTQGNALAPAAQAEPAGPSQTANPTDALSLSYSTSPDGRTWADFKPFVSTEDNISLNFLPTAARLPGGGRTDIVVFQSLLNGKPPTFQLYAKTSQDGGKTWSLASRLTNFPDTESPSAQVDAYDNERPSMASVGGKLWLTWERKANGQSPTNSPQVYALPLTAAGKASVPDLVRLSSGSGSCSAPAILDIAGEPSVIWYDDRRLPGQARVYLARRAGLDWSEVDLSGNRGPASFASAATSEGRTYSAWQSNEGGRDRIVLLEPDRSVAPPRLQADNFSPGKRTRSEIAQVSLSLPEDSSGVAGYSWSWSRDPAAQPAHELGSLPTEKTLRAQATADGPWYLAAACMDYAGNWSATARIRFDRDRTPPPPPIAIPADTDEAGFLQANSFSLRWILPDNRDGSPVDDVEGYTWELRYIGSLEAPAGNKSLAGRPGTRPGAKPGVAGPAGLPGLSAWETRLVAEAGPPLPPPSIRGSKPEVSFANVDDGYYLFSAAAIDGTGNMSDASSILLRANKYIPYTSITYAESKRDDFGHSTIHILGKGFSIEGYVERLVLDRDGKEPYDLEGQRTAGGFRVLSDTELDGLSFDDLPIGSYRVGLYHPSRAWYWTRPIINLDASGTLKFGEPAPAYKPAWTFAPDHRYALSIYDLIILIAVLFSGLGIFLLSRQAIVVARDMETIRLEVLALVSGGSMPSQAKAQEAQKLRRRGAGLRVKVTFTIAGLVIFVVLLVAVPLGAFMISSESTTLADGLREKALVLLESVAQGGRSYLPQQDILQLSFLPSQAQAMKDAKYITLTGYGSEKSTEPDVVWATNDPDILKKIDTATFQPGISRLTDGLSPKIQEILKTVNDAAIKEIGPIAATLSALNAEGQALSLKTDEASQKRFAEISTTSRSYERTISEKLFGISNTYLGTSPEFDRAVVARKAGSYIFFKPVVYRRGQDQFYYRGLVRLEVSTDIIVGTVQRETKILLLRTAIYASIALGLGVLGAFILSSVIVIPIRKVVKAIERIRDTENKETLHDLKIEVASRDEIRILADTINEMTEGLVKAAAASKELVVGKGIQKMFIPLDPTPDGQAKFSTGHKDEKDFEFFGYYEGADEVSGDYWDFQSINSRYHYFIKCDVSGHGVSAALIMVQVATMVVNYFADWKTKWPKSIDLTDLAYKINDFLFERKFKGRFAAFTLGLWDSDEGIAYLCDAGDKLLHVWIEREGRLIEQELPESPAAGPLDSDMIRWNKKAAFTQVTRQLERGDILFLYTDGIDEANHHFHDAEGRPIGTESDMEDFGYARICAILEALHEKKTFHLDRSQIPDPALTFDFSRAEDSLEEKIVALVAVEKVFRMYRSPQATKKDFIVVDGKVDEFLRKKKYFDQIRLFVGPDEKDGTNPNVLPLGNSQNPGYVTYRGVLEDPQDDDLTFLGIRRK